MGQRHDILVVSTNISILLSAFCVKDSMERIQSGATIFCKAKSKNKWTNKHIRGLNPVHNKAYFISFLVMMTYAYNNYVCPFHLYPF